MLACCVVLGTSLRSLFSAKSCRVSPAVSGMSLQKREKVSSTVIIIIAWEATLPGQSWPNNAVSVHTVTNLLHLPHWATQTLASPAQRNNRTGENFDISPSLNVISFRQWSAWRKSLGTKIFVRFLVPGCQNRREEKRLMVFYDMDRAFVTILNDCHYQMGLK